MSKEKKGEHIITIKFDGEKEDRLLELNKKRSEAYGEGIKLSERIIPIQMEICMHKYKCKSFLCRNMILDCGEYDKLFRAKNKYMEELKEQKDKISDANSEYITFINRLIRDDVIKAFKGSEREGRKVNDRKKAKGKEK